MPDRPDADQGGGEGERSGEAGEEPVVRGEGPGTEDGRTGELEPPVPALDGVREEGGAEQDDDRRSLAAREPDVTPGLGDAQIAAMSTNQPRCHQR